MWAEVRRQERRQQQQRESYQLLYDFAPVMYLVVDTTGVIVEANTTACRLLQRHRDAIVGFPLRAYITQSDRPRFLEHLRRCRREEGTVETEVRMTAADGGEFTGRVFSKRSLFGGRLVFPTIVVDITELLILDRARQAAEQQRDRAQHEREIAHAADLAKDRLIAIVSHELRNPLSPALMAADALARWGGLPDTVKRLGTIIKRNIELEARLVDDLLDLARVTRGRLELQLDTVDVHQVLLELVAGSQRAIEAKNLGLTLDLDAAQPLVRADETRLRQVLANLLNNAIKFSDAGTIRVRTFNRTRDSIRIEVADSGIGMDRATLDRLFAPFGQNDRPAGQRGGLGLGLFIAKGIMEAHHGRIAARSPGPGKGSTIEVEFPLCDAPIQGAVRPEQRTLALDTSEPQASAPRRALIVEDHPDTADLLSMFLRERGCAVVVARTLADGLDRIDDRWDLVISDIGLADGSGLDIARRARALRHPPRTLIALSGFGGATDVIESRRAGFDDHLVKPVDLDQLAETLTKT